jgi:hypothetical protein
MNQGNIERGGNKEGKRQKKKPWRCDLKNATTQIFPLLVDVVLLGESEEKKEKRPCPTYA